jgi:hypothetical protein
VVSIKINYLVVGEKHQQQRKITGNWQLATSNWQLATGNWQLKKEKAPHVHEKASPLI